MLQRENKLFLGIFIGFLAFILISSAISFRASTERYNELHAELLQVRQELQRATAERMDLEMEVLLFDSDAYIERLARERLGMIRPNQFVIVNIAD